MEELMSLPKVLALAGLAAAFTLSAQVNANLAQVQTVYIQPMSGGLHQHLAARMVSLGLFQLVTDPHRADAILTDKLNDGFEARLLELDKQDEERAKTPEQKKKEADEKAAAPSNQSGPPNFTLAERPLTTSLGGGKGTFFLVDRKSRRLLWSVYARPKNSTPSELYRVAGRISDKLKNDWSGKK